jgi:cysteinyl-tRNA synthetase
VPDHAIAVGVPAKVVKKKVTRMMEEGPVESVTRVYMPDPVEECIHVLEKHIAELEKRIERLEGKGGVMRIYNTLTARKEELVPLTPGRIGMYACGVTVYDLCHIGHARSAIVFDVLKRYLRFRGLEVKYVRNFTDVDDKIIKRAKEEGIGWDAVARKYTDEYYRDMDRLGVERADVEPRATEHIPEMIAIVKALVDKGYAYSVGGDVYFEVKKFSGYGKLSKRDIDDMLAGARVEVDERKRSPMDFALWKSSKEGEPSWDSPWGPGRPGWHIECTAMSIKHIGESFDIHGGGADLIFPHHENELAQSEAYTGKPFVKYWVHNGFITIDKEKMSKSLGNFFTIREILDTFDPEVVRFFLLSTHYRSPIEFSDESLREAEASIDRYYTTVIRMDDFLNDAKDQVKTSAEERALEEALSAFMEKFQAAMDDDLNTAQALGHIFELIREVNRYLDTKPSGLKARDLTAKAREQLRATGNVLSLFTRKPGEWYEALMRTKRIPYTKEEILGKIKERQDARLNKDWAKADAVRKELEAQGIILEDKKDGTSWKVKIGK